MNKTDLREYSEEELSLNVFNDEGLYLNRHNEGFIESLREIFIFDETQEETLINDLKEDLEE